jgi:NDP-sugar pyrophosphorylase family protein
MNPTTLGVHGVLQTGGQGNRLRPVSREVPKPLVKVGGVAMVERLLRQFVDCGVKQISLITGYRGDRVEAHVQTLYGLPDDVHLDFIRETQPMGNIGALGQLTTVAKPILFAFGDLVTDLDFAQLVAIHRQQGAQVTLTSHYETHRLQLGELVVKDQRVTAYQEKPLKQFLICSGIAVFEPEVLKLLEAGRPAGISDLIRTAIGEGMHVIHWTHGAFWMDVNTPEALQEAELALAKKAPIEPIEPD